MHGVSVCVLSSAFFAPGQIQVNTAQGVMSVVVPQGVTPGQSFNFQLPAVPIAQAVVGTAVSAMLIALVLAHPHAHSCPDPRPRPCHRHHLRPTLAITLTPTYTLALTLTRWWPRSWPSRSLRSANRLASNSSRTIAVVADDLFAPEVGWVRRAAWPSSAVPLLVNLIDTKECVCVAWGMAFSF